jgi:hypothetical protein
VAVMNTSDRPIYDAALHWHRGSESFDDYPFGERLGTIMPGGEASSWQHFPPDTNMAFSGAVLRFRDTAGHRWLLRPDGQLDEEPATR